MWLDVHLLWLIILHPKQEVEWGEFLQVEQKQISGAVSNLLYLHFWTFNDRLIPSEAAKKRFWKTAAASRPPLGKSNHGLYACQTKPGAALIYLGPDVFICPWPLSLWEDEATVFILYEGWKKSRRGNCLRSPLTQQFLLLVLFTHWDFSSSAQLGLGWDISFMHSWYCNKNANVVPVISALAVSQLIVKCACVCRLNAAITTRQ